MNQGTTLLIPSGDTLHLFITLTEVHSNPPYQVLLVPVCTYDRPERQDPTCLLSSGDHEFIKTESYIAYNHVRTEPLAALVRGINNGRIIDRGLLNSEVLSSVIGGLTQSPQTKRFAIDFMEEFE